MEKHLNDDKSIIFLNQFSENVCNNITPICRPAHRRDWDKKNNDNIS
jgi:hypothetical protein